MRSKQLLILSAAWIAAVCIAHPRGDFPLDDDWSYAASVRNLIETAQLRFDDWTSMPLVVQTLWGAAWGWLFGTSGTVLRLSTAFLGLGALLSLYTLVRLVGVRATPAALLTTCLGVSPVFFCLSLTFMTDVPFLCLALASVALLTDGLLHDRRRSIWFGLAVALLATFIRQVGLAIFFGFALAVVARDRLSVRTLLKASVPPVLAGALLRTYGSVLRHTTGIPAQYAAKSDALVSIVSRFLHGHPGIMKLWLLNLGILWFHVAIALAPAFFLFGCWMERPGHRPLWMTALLTGALALVLILIRGHLTVDGDILITAGVGPLTLPSAGVAHSPAWAVVLAAAALLGLWTSVYILLGAAATARRLPPRLRPPTVLLIGLARSFESRAGGIHPRENRCQAAAHAALVRHEGQLVGHRAVLLDGEPEIDPVELPAPRERDLGQDRIRPQRERGVGGIPKRVDGRE